MYEERLLKGFKRISNHTVSGCVVLQGPYRALDAFLSFDAVFRVLAEF